MNKKYLSLFFVAILIVFEGFIIPNNSVQAQNVETERVPNDRGIVVSGSTVERDIDIQGSGPDMTTVTFTNTRGHGKQAAEEKDSGKQVILDVEIYQIRGGALFKAAQKYVETNLGPGESKTVELPLDRDSDPGSAGDYILKAGIFSKEWKRTLAWYDSLKTVQIVPNSSHEPDNNVILGSSSESYQTVKIASQPNHFTGSFVSPRRPNRVLIDIEVYRGTEKVFQKFYDDVSFEMGETKDLTADIPAVYTQAQYQWSVGIFTLGWGRLINWYDGVQKFDAVSNNPQPLISIADTDMPHQPVSQGQSFTITPRLVSTGAVSSNLYIVVSLNKVDGGAHDQTIYPNQTLAADTPTPFSHLATSTLPTGSYAASVQVFHDFLGNVRDSQMFELGTVVIE